MAADVDRVLVPTDGAPLSRDALAYALAVHPTAEIAVLHVIDYVEEMDVAEAMIGREELRERTTERAEALLADVTADVTDDVTDDDRFTTAYVFGTPAAEIISFAEDHDIDLIVMGSHGRTGLSRVILGSVAQSVLKDAPVPVTIIR